MTRADVELPGDICGWVADLGGGRLVRVTRVPGGARREAWLVDVERRDGSIAELFLRYDRTDPQETVDPWTLHREASVYLALQNTDVLVPRVLGVHPVHQAMLSERLVGGNWFSRITDAEEALATARHFMEQLAALHRLDPSMLDLPDFPASSTIPNAVVHELDEWDRIIEQRDGEPEPLLEFALGWLRRNVPDHDGPVVLVQGDTGPGNFMYAGGRVIAVVDWELAHLGDPMDDIAWLSLRATQEPFPGFTARLREYEELSGHAIDIDRVRYYQVMAETKLQVMAHGARRAASGGGGDPGNRLIYGLLHRRLWLEALAAVIGIEPTRVEIPPQSQPGPHAALYDVALDQLREVIVPSIDDPLAQTRAKGLARVIKYLASVDADGDFYDACEMADIEALVGSSAGSLTTAREAVVEAARAGAVDIADYLRYLWRRSDRETELARPAMGVLADRHWPRLT